MRHRPALVDAAALLAFVVVGVLSHDASAGAFVRDALCILGGWFAAALATGLYTRPARGRLAATWIAGLAVGLAARGLVVGHRPPADFVAVAYAFTALFVLAARLAARLRS